MGDRRASRKTTARAPRWWPAAPLAAGAVALAVPAAAGAGTLPARTVRHGVAPVVLTVVRVPGHGAALATARGDSVYALSSEKGAKLTCTGRCASIWPPVVVAASVTAVRVGAGVAGHVGLVRRGSKTKQVTFNGYPLYGFVGDKGPHEDHGEGIVNFGGTWALVRPGARSVAATLMLPVRKSTTTSSSSSGGSW